MITKEIESVNKSRPTNKIKDERASLVNSTRYSRKTNTNPSQTLPKI